ncbi:MAG: NAD(P)-dependent oxidoreductase [Rhizobacter sp.]|nr:NAD(P)-dependent oxidoreductase [Chlorobiales bacterium]
MKTLLITGAGGFLGGHLAKYFFESGWRVYGLGRSSCPVNTKPCLHRYHTGELPGDESKTFIDSIKPDVVIHAAGASLVSRSLAEPYEDFAATVPATMFLLEALQKSVPRAKLLYLSSAAVYGNPTELPVKETAEVKPLSPYGYHKYLCEILCREFNNVYGLQTSVLRIFSGYGEGLHKQVLWDVCEKLQQSQTLELFGTGDETRDFIHAEDIAAAALYCLNMPSPAMQTFNAGSGTATSIRRIAELLASHLRPDAKIRFNSETMSGYPIHWQASTDALRQTGYEPRVNLEAGISRYAAWYSAQRGAAMLSGVKSTGEMQTAPSRNFSVSPGLNG